MKTAAGLRNDARAVWAAGLEAVRADRLVARAIRVRGETLFVAGEPVSLRGVRRIAVVGAGKAGATMARGLVEAMGPRAVDAFGVRGWINVPGGQGGTAGPIVLHEARSSHENRPGPAGVAGSDRMVELAGELGPRDVLLCLVSGGGSALWPAPAPGIDLEDKQAVTDLLLASGATIREMNAVRKHLSRIKGGGLVGATRARVVTLLISDVIGDPLDVIASGPTAPDPTTYADAHAVLERYRLLDRAPHAVVEHLRRGLAGALPETLKRPSARVRHAVLGTNRTALEAAGREARRRGYRTLLLSSRFGGESAAAGVTLARLVESIRDDGLPLAAPACVLAGGETTVALGPGAGKGGRNQELVLAALVRLGRQGLRDAVVLSAGTDGEDGPTDAAGAFADAAVARRAQASGMDAAAHLARHDAYPIFDAAGGLLRTGPTGTNVMDLQVLLVGPPRPASRAGKARAATPRSRARPRSRQGRG